MKKITLFSFLGLALLIAGSLFAKDQRIWNGISTAPNNRLWDLVSANWYNPNDGFYSLGITIPSTTVDSATVIFDDSAGDSTKVKVVGNMIADSILINTSKNYSIDVNASGATISGKGKLIKNGTGTVTMNVTSALLGGTIINAGRVQMLNQATPNIFGAKLVLNGGIANFATSTSSTAKDITVPVEIPSGSTGIIECSRYTNWMSPVTGSGNLQIYSGGERVYIGKKGGSQVDWTKFTGNVRVDKYVMTGVASGFYGLILNSTKTFVDDSNMGTGVDSTFYNRRLTLGTGTGIGAESASANPRAFYMGELITEDSTAFIAGYYKSSNGPKVYYLVGGLNTDVVFPGRIGQVPGLTTHYEYIQFIKVGTGTYTLTNNNNDMVTGGLIVRNGKVLICDKVLIGKYLGGVGAITTVETNGTLGGTGRISGDVTISGKLEPGANGIGTLLLSDSIVAAYSSKYKLPFSYSLKQNNGTSTYTRRNGGTSKVNLNLLSGSTSTFEIGSVSSYDQLVATGAIKFGADNGAGKPKIKIIATSGATINDGDRFTIIKTRSLDAASSDFSIEYPNVPNMTWSVEAKYDTLKIDKESFTFTDHLVGKILTDSVVTTTVTLDSTIVNYKVSVIAHKQTALNDIASNNTISVYPNPSKGEFNFKSTEADITSIEIYNLQGQVIVRKDDKSSAIKLNLGYLNTGIYYAKIKTAKGSKTEKLLIE
jgi:autotransporter-associated beta strand protein